ncbi:HEPN domain-containing protein [Phorcysia thermohydrogeniphila]|uniref:HEPN domain-containing protein n=1 Tax=Phorcysia thermohydrogeniphila TaxID=936138 RepID=A0A4R1GDI0_9BACT|nr:HEPN domain-containing protein [Phorcysia thermohydrogeniphila]TCK04645.1 HEPN domain-containing protein [Phorcysia thermohydrogeniphila]
MERESLKKAEERLKVAWMALENDYLNSALSNCYQAFFYFMQGVVGTDAIGVKSYPELLSLFIKKLYRRGIFRPEQLQKLTVFAEELYAVVKGLEYYGIAFSKSHASKVEEYVSRVKSLILSYESKRI